MRYTRGVTNAGTKKGKENAGGKIREKLTCDGEPWVRWGIYFEWVTRKRGCLQKYE